MADALSSATARTLSAEVDELAAQLRQAGVSNLNEAVEDHASDAADELRYEIGDQAYDEQMDLGEIDDPTDVAMELNEAGLEHQIDYLIEHTGLKRTRNTVEFEVKQANRDAERARGTAAALEAAKAAIGQLEQLTGIEGPAVSEPEGEEELAERQKKRELADAYEAVDTGERSADDWGPDWRVRFPEFYPDVWREEQERMTAELIWEWSQLPDRPGRKTLDAFVRAAAIDREDFNGAAGRPDDPEAFAAELNAAGPELQLAYLQAARGHWGARRCIAQTDPSYAERRGFPGSSLSEPSTQG
jgi:hypothetical protein